MSALMGYGVYSDSILVGVAVARCVAMLEGKPCDAHTDWFEKTARICRRGGLFIGPMSDPEIDSIRWVADASRESKNDNDLSWWRCRQ